jgi:hypothetical protein
LFKWEEDEVMKGIKDESKRARDEEMKEIIAVCISIRKCGGSAGLPLGTVGMYLGTTKFRGPHTLPKLFF